MAIISIAIAKREVIVANRNTENSDSSKMKYRTIAFLGDSNIWTAGENLDGEKSWATWVVRALRPEIAKNYARSGATICNTINTPTDPAHNTKLLNDTNVLYNQAIRLRSDVQTGKIPAPDLIIVGGGTNDAWFADRRPGLFGLDIDSLKVTAQTKPSEATTLVRSLQLLQALLKDAAPAAQIVYVGPSLTTKAPDERVRKVNDYMEAEVGAVKLSESGLIDPQKESKRFDMTIDGVHTSVKGAKAIGEYFLEVRD